MKYLFFAILALIPNLAGADDNSHVAAAERMIDLLDTKQTIRETMITVMTNAIAGKKPQISTAESNELKQAIAEWFDKDFKYEDFRVELAQFYAKYFSEDELNTLIAFYNTSAGKKFIDLRSELIMEGMALGQKYVKANEASLTAVLQKVEAKYQPPSATTNAPSNNAGTTPNAPAK